MKTSQRGYSLVEVGVVLLAIGLILIGITLYWQQTSSLRVKASQASLQQQAKDSALGFMYARYRLACPAVDADGVENCGTSASPNAVGFVPWRTLGMANPAAGFLKYGVYRVADAANAHLDQDLAVSKDRMKPLRSRTPNPRPSNGRAPNGNSPPAPSLAENLLGDTYSGDWASPLNANCVTSNPIPCTPNLGSSASNMIDACLALHSIASQTTALAGALGVSYAGARRAAALVIAAPGLLDADADGNAFDGLNALASNSAPTFESSAKEKSSSYDDQVMVVSALEIFSMHSCAAGMAAASHAHMNHLTAALVMERAYYDFRDQLDVQVRLADADVAAAAAGLAGSLAAVAAAAGEVVSATGDSVQSLGGRSFQIGLAVAAVVLSLATTIPSGYAIGLAAQGKTDADQAWNDFAASTTAMGDLAISIANNALMADAIGF